jgi:arylsulfatase A-like enzyme
MVRHAVILAIAALCTVACRSVEPLPLASSIHLLDHLGGAAAGAIGDACPIGDEFRPALGCTAWHRAHAAVVPSGTPPRVVSFPVPAMHASRPFILQGRVAHDRGFATLPLVTHAASPVARLDVATFGSAAPEPGTTVDFWMRPAPPSRVISQPIAVPEGAVLVVGIGLDPEMDARDVEAVEFRLTAHARSGSHVLLSAVVRPGDPVAAGWQEHRIALGAATGPAVRFRFETVTTPRAGTPPAHAAAMPLRGAPENLAPPPPESAGAWNVVLVSFDTLRADYVGTYGSERPTTPHLDRLAAQGTVFERAYTTFPTTTASHVSMLTGLYPRRHGVRRPTDRVDTRVASPAQLLAAAGWRTAAVTENGMLTARAGISRGFSSYRENREPEADGQPSWTAQGTFTAASEWMASAAADRFFLFVHTYVVHWPYAPPPDFDLFTTWMDGDVERPRHTAPKLLKLRLAYAGEARFGDAQLGDFMATLRRLGLAERTLVVVTADHGEEFGEHGGWGHGDTVYDEVLHVPLVLWGPGRIPAGRRVTTPVSLVDVVPTILDLASVPVPRDLDGESQVDRVRGAPEDPERAVFAELRDRTDPTANRIAVRTATGKWITKPGAPGVLVGYDLEVDPGETLPVTDPAHTARGRRLVAGYLARAGDGASADGAAAAPEPLDAETQDKLRALGYVE